MPVTKIKVGVPGLDDILKGGVREKTAFLVSGGPGSGKTLLAMQFLVEGAKAKQPGLCILYDVDVDEYLDYADSVEIPLRKFVKEQKIFILKQPMTVKTVPSLALPLQLMRSKKIQRVVLDSLTMFSYIHVKDDRDYRYEIVNFLNHMKDVTLLATAEASGLNLDGIQFRAEEFLFDGVIFLTKVRQEASFERIIHVSKMRGQEHLINIFPFSIGKGGIKVYPDQLPFALMGEEPAGRFKK